MVRVGVITDSSACVPAEFVSSLGISVLPISAFLTESDAGDTGEGSGARLPDAVASEELAGASHPFVTEYLEAIENPGFDAAVIVTPAIEFAAMYRNAALAVEFATRPAVSIDARTAAAGQALVVLAGAEAAAKGAELDEVVRVIEDASRRVEIVASLSSLEEIRRSGPLPDDVLGDVELAGVRSVFRMRDGTVEPLGSVATAEEALAVLQATFVEGTPLGVERSTIFHADESELAERLNLLLGGVDFVSGFSVAMQIHTGGGVVGAAWIPRGEAP